MLNSTVPTELGEKMGQKEIIHNYSQIEGVPINHFVGVPFVTKAVWAFLISAWQDQSCDGPPQPGAMS